MNAGNNDDIVPSGPRLADHESLYRAVTVPTWWDPQTKRASSAAFKWPVFSVDVASRLNHDPLEMLHRFATGTGVVEFMSGEARLLGCDPRDEPDPQEPNNKAHAHVYMPAGN